MTEESPELSLGHADEQELERVAAEIFARYCATQLGQNTPNAMISNLPTVFTLAEAFVKERRQRQAARGPRGGVADRY